MSSKRGKPNGEPTAIRVSGSLSPATSTPTMPPPKTRRAGLMAQEPPERPAIARCSRREAGALCRPGRTQEKREGVSEGVSDPAFALFGPLRAGSLTPTCLCQLSWRKRPGCMFRS
jgi:hypothetical protein